MQQQLRVQQLADKQLADKHAMLWPGDLLACRIFDSVPPVLSNLTLNLLVYVGKCVVKLTIKPKTTFGVLLLKILEQVKVRGELIPAVPILKVLGRVEYLFGDPNMLIIRFAAIQECLRLQKFFEVVLLDHATVPGNSSAANCLGTCIDLQKQNQD